MFDSILKYVLVYNEGAQLVRISMGQMFISANSYVEEVDVHCEKATHHSCNVTCLPQAQDSNLTILFSCHEEGVKRYVLIGSHAEPNIR